MSTQSSESLANIAVVIPAWQPPSALIPLALGLRTAGFGSVVVVDDGSDSTVQRTFTELSLLGFGVIHHSRNLGKGQALKSGFRAILAGQPHVGGVVTADADGQHTATDIVRIGNALAASLRTAEPRPVLGTRAFDAAVPLRSRVGNALTRSFFHLLTGVRLVDTQSGLRGFPLFLLPELVRVQGERYEYEMNVLTHLCRRGSPPLPVPIQTVYIERNLLSHFDPVRDSMRVGFALVRSFFRRSRSDYS